MKDQKPDFACVLAIRAAFRVAPLLVGALHDDKAERRSSIILPSFHMLAVANVGAVWPARAVEIREFARFSLHETSNTIEEILNAVQSAIRDYKEISETPPEFADLEEEAQSLSIAENAVNAAAYAVQTVIDTVDASHNVGSAHAAVEATIAVCTSAHSAIDGAHGHAELFSILEANDEVKYKTMPHIAEFWGAVGQDAQFLETCSKEQVASVDAVKSLSEKPLWFEDIPVWVGRKWANFRDELLGNESWWVWIDWYESRLKGKTLNETPEFDRITIPVEDWQQGPTHVNTIIAKLLETETDPLVAAISRGFEELDMVQQIASVDLSQHVHRIRAALPDDPQQAIGATKEMLESTMKTILVRRKCKIEDNIKFPQLTNRCLNELGLVKSSHPTTKSERYLRKISSSAREIIQAINEYRSHAGTGHGRAVGSEPVVTAPDASLAASAGLILAAWLLRHDKGV